jgi:hypothetical protein
MGHPVTNAVKKQMTLKQFVVMITVLVSEVNSVVHACETAMVKVSKKP